MKLAAIAFLKPKNPDGTSALTVDEAIRVLRVTTARNNQQQECLDVIEAHLTASAGSEQSG